MECGKHREGKEGHPGAFWVMTPRAEHDGTQGVQDEGHYVVVWVVSFVSASACVCVCVCVYVCFNPVLCALILCCVL